MPETDARWLWYERPGFVIGALIVFWPLGLVLMWTQEKFTRRTRVGLSAALPIISVLVAMAAWPRPATTPPAQPAAASTTAETTSAAALATGTATSASSSPSATRTAGAGTKGATPPSASKPAPAPAPGPAEPGTPQSRFTLSGSYKASGAVKFTLQAAQSRGITKYEWWVTALDRTTRYVGESVSDSYVGHPPESVMLIATDAAGKTYLSNATVTITGESMSAEAK